MQTCYVDMDNYVTVDLIDAREIILGGWIISRVMTNPFRGNRGAGHASALMKQVCEEADAEGVALWLEIQVDAEDTTALCWRDLEDWYQRLGFGWSRQHPGLMRRGPQ